VRSSFGCCKDHARKTSSGKPQCWNQDKRWRIGEAVDARTDQTAASHGALEAGVVASSVYSGGRRIKDIAIEEAGEWSQRPGHVVWIGLFEPSTDLLKRVQAQLRLHYLAIEDAGKAHQHPKIEQ
jgi:magnesium transporter